MSRRDELGTVRRSLLMLFGLMLAGNLQGGPGLTWMVGAFGVAVFLAAAGVVELAMALWYRSQRRQPRL